METLQPGLFDLSPPVEIEPEETIEDRFWQFHEENKHVAKGLQDLAHQLKAEGHTCYGMRALFEVLRFKRRMTTTGRQFKLNNNYTPFYARWLMIWDPELEGFFELRDHDKGAEDATE